MNGLWKDYNGDFAAYEHNFPMAFPWQEEEKQDIPRYILGPDGWWYDPKAKATGKALLSCTGDLMCEPAMTNAHRFGDSYFFHPLFQFVRPILKGSDFSVANLETLIGTASPYAGQYHRVNRKFHCNGPESYLDALRYAGFDALVTANNHNCDAGITGLFDTLNALDRHSFPHTGTYRNETEERVLLVKICGIKVAILSYATYYNRLDTANFTEKGKAVVLNYFSEEKYKADAAYARAKGAEFMLCYIHWGDDYDDVPNANQYKTLDILKELDVDYIMGSHTHCFQRHDIAVSSAGKKIPMMFSMGNFVTNEGKELCKHTGILQLMLTRQDGRIALEEKLIPCYVHTEFAGARYCVVPTDPILNGGYFGQKMDQIDAYIRNRVGEDLEFLPSGRIALGELCKAMDAQCPEHMENHPVTGLAAQVGAINRGSLYFSFDDEKPFARNAITRHQPCAVVCEKPIEGRTCILVSDVKAAFQKACAAVPRPKCKTILVAGPENKTLTVRLVKAILEERYKVYAPADEIHTDIAPWQKLHPATEVCLLELREDHPMAEVLPETIRPDYVVLTGDTPSLPALEKTGAKLLRPKAKVTADLPFDDQLVAVGAALAVAEEFGIDADLTEEIAAYRAADLTKNALEHQGLRLLLHLSCKENAQAAFDALSREKGRKIAVLGDKKWLKMAKADKVFLFDKTERELEKELLTTLQTGDAVLFLGSRDDLLCVTVRRLFGLTNGYFPNSEYWSDEPIVL